MADGVSTADLVEWVRTFARSVSAEKDQLTALDAAIGDADHGANMDRALTAVGAVLDDPALDTPAALFKKVGMALVSTVGGASGPLYGTFFLRLGASRGDVQAVSPGSVAAGQHRRRRHGAAGLSRRRRLAGQGGGGRQDHVRRASPGCRRPGRRAGG